MYTVYLLRVPDGRVYVGATKDLKKRWNNGNGYRFSKKLWEQIVLHGWESIEKEIVAENLTETDACKLEQETIKKYRSFDPEYGFNRELGGTLKSKIVPDNVKAHMGETRRGQLNHNYGKHFTEEHKAKLAASNRGKKRSDLTRERCQKAHEKKVAQYTLSGQLVATYQSGKKAAEATGACAGHIAKVCKGQRKSAGGFFWSYA